MGLSTELLKVWFIFSFSLGCWTCLNLIISRRGDKRVKRTILAFIVLLLVPPLNAYINLVTPGDVGWLLVLSQKLTWCYGPIMVALISHILLRAPGKLNYLLHAVPFFVASLHDIANLQLIGFAAMVSLLFIQVFSYLAYAAYLLKTERARLLKLTRQFKNTTYYWLIYLVASLFVIMVIDMGIYSRILAGHTPPVVALATVASLIAIVVNSIALFSLYQPEVFTHHLTEEEIVKPQTSTRHFRSIELSAEAAQQLDEQLLLLVKNHKPHLDEDISLPKLAALLGVTSHQLSELLNIHKSTNFYEFLNEICTVLDF